MTHTRTKLRSFLLALLTASVAGTAAAEDKIALRLDYVAGGFHAPFYYGVEKGFYRDQGIDLQILEGKSSGNSATLVGTGSADFAFADATTTARLISQGLPVKVVMGIWQKPTLAIFFPANSSIKTPDDLKGQRISMCASDGMAQYVPAYLKAVKLQASDVKFVTVDCSAKYIVVAQGQADAVASYSTAGGPLLSAVGIPDSKQFNYGDAGVPLPAHGIVTSVKSLSERPDLVKRFNAATAKSWLAAKENPEAAATAFVTANPLMKDRQKIIHDSLLVSLAHLVPQPGKPFGWQPPEGWEAAKKVLVEFTGMPATAQIDSFFTNDFLTP